MSWLQYPKASEALTYLDWIAEQLTIGKPFAVVDHTELTSHLANLRQFVYSAARGDLCEPCPEIPEPTEDEYLDLVDDRWNDEDLSHGFHIEEDN